MRVETKAFFQAVDYVAKGTARETGVPILSGIRIDARPGEVGIRASDLEVVVETAIPAMGSHSWDVVVDPKSLKPAKLLADQTLDLAVRREDGKKEPNLVLATGPDEETILAGMEAEKFPEVPAGPHLYGMAEAGRWELSLLPHLLKHTAGNGSRPLLTGVYLDQDGWTASDGHRLLHIPHREGAATFDGLEGVVLRRRSLELLLASPYEVERATIQVLGSPPEEGSPRPQGVLLEAGRVRIWSRILEGRFPPYRDILCHSTEHHQFGLDPDHFPRAQKVLQAAERMAKRGSAVVTLRFADGHLTLEAQEADVGSLRAKIPATPLNGVSEAGNSFQARFLADMLNTFRTLNEPARVTVADRLSHWVTPSGVIGVICPVRVG